MTQTTTGYVEIDGGIVYYEVAGEGMPLALLHTGFADSRMWHGQWPDFSRHYTAIRFDMRGFGRSDRATQPISRRQELRRVLDHLGVDRAILVGCSLGGETILDFALEHPDRVSGLVVVSAVPGAFSLRARRRSLLCRCMRRWSRVT